MTYLVKVLDELGNFELIDSEFLWFYPNLNLNELIQITDKQYQEFCRKDNGRTKFLNGNFVFEKITVDKTARLEQARNDLIRYTAEKVDLLKAQILIGYPQAEIDSFYRQEREARAWVDDNQNPTPMLSGIAERRGVSLEILVQKVIEKADQFAVIMGQIIGTRQKFEDCILAAKTMAELTACEQEIEQWQLAKN